MTGFCFADAVFFALHVSLAFQLCCCIVSTCFGFFVSFFYSESPTLNLHHPRHMEMMMETEKMCVRGEAKGETKKKRFFMFGYVSN